MIILVSPIFLLILMCSPVAWGADFQKGLTAAQNGDYVTAFREWTPLAEQGNAKAQSNLGAIYGNGQGILQDDVYAHMWWNIVASNGNESATKNREIVAKKMTPSDISKAQQLARECVAKEFKDC